jgi:hypothetical protein
VRTLNATRYVTPLREGGSVPAIVEADDGALWVLKLGGAGQGRLALAAELIAGELGRALGLAVPELVLVELDAALGRNEPDAEIRDLLKASIGTNVGLAYLSGALPFDPAAHARVDGLTASLVVLLDSYVMNVDRTARNPNLLWWHGRLWLIDHGAALYWQHSGKAPEPERGFPFVRDHVLLPWADALPAAGDQLRAALTDELIARVVTLPPAAWLTGPPRTAYLAHLVGRRAAIATVVEEAIRARAQRL